ncbi:hypothetical protein Tco_0750527 [Tanacetum coccineum]|uniref:Uncharacterized protein n=1 Tax=Tanacetum coccineum TaxID=301880 RepID=A0ABQ4Z451_9ASTR
MNAMNTAMEQLWNEVLIPRNGDALHTLEASKFLRADGKSYVWPVWPGKEAYVTRLNREEIRATTDLNEKIIQLVLSTNIIPSVHDEVVTGQVAPVHYLDPMLDRISVLCKNLSQIQYTRSYWPGEDTFAAERLDYEKTAFTSELN